MNAIKSRYIEILIVLFSAIIAACFFEAVPEDYMFFAINISAGQLSDYNYFDYYFLGFIGLAEGYKVLYHLLPKFNWLGISFILFALLSHYLFLRTIRYPLFRNVKNEKLILLAQLFFSFFIIENYFFINYTRYSLALCSIAILNLLLTPKLSRNIVIKNAFILILGTLIRPESSMGILVIAAGGFLVYRFDIIDLLKRLALPIAVAVTVFVGVSVDVYYSDWFVKKLEPEIEYKMMDNKLVDISTMKTKEDSVKYKMAKIGMWFDYKVFSPEYLRSIQTSGFDFGLDRTNNNAPIPANIKNPQKYSAEFHPIAVLRHVYKFYKKYAFVFFLTITALILAICSSAPAKNTNKILLITVGTFVLIFAIDYNGFMLDTRHFISLQSISMIFIVAILLEGKCHEIAKRNMTTICMALLIIGTGLNLVYYKLNNREHLKEMQAKEGYMDRLEQTYQNRLIVLTNDCYTLQDRGFSILNNNYKKNKYIMFDNFTYSLTPNYQNYLHRLCDCDPADPVAFYTWLSKKNALYIACDKRFNLTEQYMNLTHDYPVRFEKPEIIDKKMPTSLPVFEPLEIEVKQVVTGTIDSVTTQ